MLKFQQHNILVSQRAYDYLPQINLILQKIKEANIIINYLQRK